MPSSGPTKLLRGERVISSLAGALGSGLRETRLTAWLGYIIALAPEDFCELFKFPGRPRSVSLETHHDDGRSDILIETSKGKGVVEAKVGHEDPHRQSARYPANWRVLLTEYIPPKSAKKKATWTYLRWRDLSDVLHKHASSRNAGLRFLSTDLLTHLQHHHLMNRDEPTEIYARELNEERTLSLFLHGRIYGCPYEKRTRLPEGSSPN